MSLKALPSGRAAPGVPAGTRTGWPDHPGRPLSVLHLITRLGREVAKPQPLRPPIYAMEVRIIVTFMYGLPHVIEYSEPSFGRSRRNCCRIAAGKGKRKK